MSITLKSITTGGVFICSSYVVSGKNIVLDHINFIDGPISSYIVVTDGKYSTLTALQFYLAFSPAERIAIKKSTDPIVEDFWETYQFAASQGATIDPNLSSIIEGLAYLSNTNKEPPSASPWVANAVVSIGQQVSIGNNVYICTTSGTTATEAITETGTSITDGTAVWSYTPTPYIVSERISMIQAGIPQ